MKTEKWKPGIDLKENIAYEISPFVSVVKIKYTSKGQFLYNIIEYPQKSSKTFEENEIRVISNSYDLEIALVRAIKCMSYTMNVHDKVYKMVEKLSDLMEHKQEGHDFCEYDNHEEALDDSMDKDQIKEFGRPHLNLLVVDKKEIYLCCE